MQFGYNNHLNYTFANYATVCSENSYIDLYWPIFIFPLFPKEYFDFFVNNYNKKYGWIILFGVFYRILFCNTSAASKKSVSSQLQEPQNIANCDNTSIAQEAATGHEMEVDQLVPGADECKHTHFKIIKCLERIGRNWLSFVITVCSENSYIHIYWPIFIFLLSSKEYFDFFC